MVDGGQAEVIGEAQPAGAGEVHLAVASDCVAHSAILARRRMLAAGVLKLAPATHIIFGTLAFSISILGGFTPPTVQA